MPNRLASEKSPYLHQHADNPVDWYPWGPEALAKAAAEDKPILLSIGYSACHWCHVMAHESFEDAGVAAVMNRLFVNIKVDREERPDLDRIYQQAHQLLNGRPGGWPLNVVLTPDDHMPYFSGTYFPKTPRHNLPGFPELLERLAAVWHERREDVRSQNAQLGPALRSGGPKAGVTGYAANPAPLEEVRGAILDKLDAENGGFGSAPKFPQAELFARLLRIAAGARLAGTPDTQVEAAVRLALASMTTRGLYDQIGGGFFRYSVDARWEIPHFEKMLYDQAALLGLLGDAVAAGLLPEGGGVLAASIGFLARELRAPEGGFYATLDADSEGHEGRYYVWTPDEIRAALPAGDYALAAAVWGLDGAPNFEGRWHLGVRRLPVEVAAGFGLDAAAVDARLDAIRARLLAVRAARVYPHRDEKILTAWNALLIGALARAGRLHGRADWIALAADAHAFLREHCWREGRLYAVCKDGEAYQPAFLDDHAYLLDATLELLQCRWQPDDLHFAQALADQLLDRFADPKKGGFHYTPVDGETLIARPKPLWDDALPGPNGVAARALLVLGRLLNRIPYLVAAEKVLKWAWPGIESHPLGTTTLLGALEEYFRPGTTVVLRGTGEALQRWQQRSSGRYAAQRVTIAIPDDAADLPEALALRSARADGPVAYLCTGTQCSAPITDFAAFEAELAQQEPRFG